MQFHIPGCRPEPPDELNAKGVHLTYAGLHRGELTHDSLLQSARRWGEDRSGLLEYVTGRELHAQPADPSRDEHFHCYFSFGKKVHLSNRRTSTVFDLPGRGGRRLHPEIQSIGNLPGDRQRVIEYDMKDGDWRGELREQLVRDKPLRQPVGSDDEGSTDDEPEKGNVPAWARRLQQAANVRVGMQRLFEESPHIYFTQGSRIEQMLTQAVGSPDEKLFTLDDFNQPALDLSLPVVLTGESGSGKSEYAAAHFAHPLICRRRDDLKRATFNTDGIIFDDMDFRDWTIEETIHLLSVEKNRSVGARYSDATIAAWTPLIFTTNKRHGKIFPRAKGEQRRAIRRRHRVVTVAGKLQRLGRAFTAAELLARRSAGKNGPQGPP